MLYEAPKSGERESFSLDDFRWGELQVRLDEFWEKRELKPMPPPIV